MTENRPEVVRELIDAHNATRPEFALAAVEFEHAPTQSERDEARVVVVDARNAELRRLGGLDK